MKNLKFSQKPPFLTKEVLDFINEFGISKNSDYTIKKLNLCKKQFDLCQIRDDYEYREYETIHHCIDAWFKMLDINTNKNFIY